MPIQLNLWLDKTHLHGEFRGAVELSKTYEVFERNHKFELQWWGGYTRHNQIWRTVTDSITNEQKEELITENHAVMMYNPLLSYT